jgi:hypothetical protein
MKFLILCLFLSSASFANELRDQLGPVRNQWRTNICFAHAVADALTVKTGQRVGAFSIAIRYFEKRRNLEYFFMSPVFNTLPNQLQAGMSSEALRTAAENTVCNQRKEFRDGTVHEDQFSELLTTHQSYRSTISPYEPVEKIDKLKKLGETFLPGLNSDNLISLLSPFKSLEKTYGEWIDNECEIKIDQYEIIGSELGFQSKQKRIELINEALNLGAVPIVHYNVDFLFGERAPFYGKLVGLHVNTIVDRRIKNGVKEYLFRNTWGTSCNFTSPYRENCRNGHFWVSEDIVKKEVTSVTYIL